MANQLFAFQQTLPQSQQRIFTALVNQATQGGQVQGFSTHEQEEVDEAVQRLHELLGRGQ